MPAGPIATEPEFAALLGRPVPAPRPLWPLHLDSTISDLRQSRLGAKTSDALLKVATKQFDLGPDAATEATLKAAVVPSAIYYPKPLHLQPAYRDHHRGAPLPVSEALAGRILALPMHAYLSEADAARVCDAVIAATG